MVFSVGLGELGDGLAVCLLCAFKLELHQGGEFGGALCGENLCFGYAEAGKLVLRQVDSFHACVFADIADDVGQLEGEAQCFGVLQGALVGVAEDAGNQPPDYACDAVAIVLQVVKGGVAVVVQVHFHAADDVGKFAFGQPENGDDGAQGLVGGVFGHGVGPEGFCQILPPPCQGGAGDGGVAVVVGDVFQFAAEGVEYGYGIAFFGRQEAEAGQKAGLAGAGFFAAVV